MTFLEETTKNQKNVKKIPKMKAKLQSEIGSVELRGLGWNFSSTNDSGFPSKQK